MQPSGYMSDIADLFRWRGRAWIGKQEYDKAIDDFTMMIRLHPKNAAGYLHRAYAWSQKPDDDKAIADYTAAIEIDPHEIAAYDGRAHVWIRKKDFDKAIADSTALIRMNPRRVSAFTIRAWAWSQKQEYDKAIEDNNEAIRLLPNNPDVYYCRAKTWERKGDGHGQMQTSESASSLIRRTAQDLSIGSGRNAVESATRACELTARKQARCLDTLAAAYAEAGDFAAAVNWQTKAIELEANPAHEADCRARLKMCQEKMP